MKGVQIINLEVIKDDDRGKTYQFDNRDTPKILLIKRNQGTISGGHYHTGKNKLKDPETLVIVEGTCDIFLKNVKTNEESREIYNKPVMLKIDPYIFHEVIAKTDIIMMDMNSIDDDDDTIKGMEE